MNIQNFKKYAFSLALAIGFVIAPGLSSLGAAQAQGWGWGRDRRDDRWERREEQRGYRDGFNMGRKDARSRRRPDFDDYGQYRRGSRDYREGFRRGYFQAYREYARYDRGRWDRDRW
jgi:hypothetical protein